MKKMLLAASLVISILAASGWVVAQNAPAPVPKTATAPSPAKPAAHDHAAMTAAAGEHDAHGGGMACGMMGGGMMGGGMMGGGMMGGGLGAMFGKANTVVDVKKLDKGVTITFTSPDAATVVRLQKMAEAMRLMHEATAP